MRFKTVCSYFLNPLNGLVYFAFPQAFSPDLMSDVEKCNSMLDARVDESSCSSLCDLSEICVSYIEQPLSVWYIWVFLLVLLILIVRCVVACCLQCYVKRQARFSSRKMTTVVTLSGSDFIYESPQCPYPQSWSSHQTSEASVSSVSLGELELGAPPSYEDLFTNRKF